MRVLKIAAVAIGALLVLAIVATIIVALTFDPNNYKDYAQTWVEERTGRSLTIEGDIELSLFPWLAVQTGYVELGNAPNFGPEPFVAAQRVSARVRLLPLLLNREFEIGTVSADGLELDLAIDANGASNWSDLLATGADGSEQSQEQANPGSSDDTADALAGLDIEGIELRGSRVVWRENGTPRYIVSELSLSTGPIAPATPVDIELETDLLDVVTQRTAHVALTTRAAASQDGEISASGSTIDFTIGDASGNTDAEGSAEVDSLEFLPGVRLTTGPVQLTNTADSIPITGTALASDLAWNALEVDLAELDVEIDDFEATANGIQTRWQIVGENLADESAILRGSVVVDDSPAAAAIELSGLALPEGMQADETGNFSGSTAFVFEPTAGDFELSNLDLSALGVELSVQQAVLRGDILSAQINVEPFQPNPVLRRLIEPYLPEGVDAGQLGTIAFQAGLFGTPEDFSITEMRFAALNAEVTGQLEVQPRDSGVNISGDIASNRFMTDAMLALAGNLVPESITPETTGPVSVDGRFAWNAAQGSLTTRGLQLEAFGLQGSGDITVNGIGSTPDVTGTLQLQPFDPRDLLSRFDLAVPQTSDDSALRSAAINTEFGISSDSASFENLSISLDQSQITGSFNVSSFDDPFYRFSLTADQLDVDRYLPPQTPPGADEQVAAGEDERRAGDIALSNDALSAVNIDADVRVGALRLAGMDFSNVTTSMIVGQGRMLLDSAHADLYGGAFDGSFRVDASTDVPNMQLQGSAQRLQLTPLITALADSANFSGTGSFDIDLTGRGPTVTDNLRSAAGTMGFELLDGAIEGFNVDKSLCRAFNNVRGNPAPRDEPDRSGYEYIRGSATVTDGIATSNDLVASIGSAEIRGSGTLALADQVVDYNFDARLARAVPIAGCEEMERIVGNDFPVDVRGPLSGPEIAPDYNEVIRRILEYRIREEVRDRLLESIFD